MHKAFTAVIVSLLVTGCSNLKEVVPVKAKPDVLHLNGDRVLGPPLQCGPNIYPRRALYAGQEGWVLFKVDIDAEGKTTNLEVLDSSPAKMFVHSAVRYRKDCVYAPYKVNGVNTAVKGHLMFVNYGIVKEDAETTTAPGH